MRRSFGAAPRVHISGIVNMDGQTDNQQLWSIGLMRDLRNGNDDVSSVGKIVHCLIIFYHRAEHMPMQIY
jgi:hypothetical protein